MKTAEAYYQEALSFQQSDPEKALELFQLAADTDPNYVATYNSWGNTLLNLDRTAEAQEKYKKSIELAPDYKWAFYNLARTYEESDPEEAISLYKRTTEIDPGYIEAYNGWGNVLLEQGKKEEAAGKYEKSIEIDPGFKYAYYNLGRLYAKVDDEKAANYFRLATEKDPEYTAAFNAWGNVLLDLKRYKEAIRKYEQCLAIDPTYKWAAYNIAIVYEKVPDLEKALPYYKQATEIDPEYKEVYNSWGGTLLELKRKEEAREKYQKCLEIDDQYKTAYFNLGVSYEPNELEKAAAYYQKATEVDPDYIDAFNSWGNALLNTNQLEQAREKYRQCIELDPDYQWAYTNYYFSIAKSDDKQVLTEAFRELVEAKHTASGYWALGNLYQYTLKEYEKSLQCYDKSVELGKVKDRFLDISNLYDARGDLHQALEVIEEALRQEPDSIYARHNKAHFLFKMGQYEESRKTWREVINRYKQAFKENAVFRKDSFNYLYCGTIHYEIFGEIAEAEALFQQGIDMDEQNMRLLLGMNQLHAEKDKRAIHPDLSTYWKRNTNVKRVETQFHRTEQTDDDTFQLAEMYFIEEKYDEALELIDKYLEKGPESPNWHSLQGQILMAKEDFAKSVTAFKKAVRLEPHHITHLVNLANAYLKNKNTHEAEKGFLDILKRDPNNVEALIGLGEIYLNRSDDDKDENLLDKAEKYLKEAILLGKSDKGSKRLDMYTPKGPNQQRQYKDLKLSDIYYSMGYLKAKRFEREQVGFDPALLKESLRYFTLSHETDPDNLKAIASKKKIENNLKTTRKSSRFEQFGAWAITILSFLIFLLCQYFFYFHGTETEKYSLNEQGANYLGSVLVLPDADIGKLKNLSGIVFEEKATLIEAIKAVVGSEALANKQVLISQIDLNVKASTEATPLLPTGYYALISFGALIFMIAGLYLPKLLKLKVGVIEIEKNSPSEVNNISLLGIQK